MSADCGLGDARSIVFLAVETCSKAVSMLGVGHGKSPWFSRVCFLALFGVDWVVQVSRCLDVGFFSECAI